MNLETETTEPTEVVEEPDKDINFEIIKVVAIGVCAGVLLARLIELLIFTAIYFILK